MTKWVHEEVRHKASQYTLKTHHNHKDQRSLVSKPASSSVELRRTVNLCANFVSVCHAVRNISLDASFPVRSQVGEDSSNRKFLVSRLFDVAEGSTVEESSSSCIRLEWNKGIVGHVAATGQPLNIKNAYEVRVWRSAGAPLGPVMRWVAVCVETGACLLRVNPMVLADRART